MSILQFLKTGRRSKKPTKKMVAPVKQESRADRFAAMWKQITSVLEGVRTGREDENPVKVRKLINTRIHEMIGIVTQEREQDGVGEAPPCFELMLKHNVIGKMCIYAVENTVRKINCIMLKSLGNMVLLVGESLNKPLIGHFKQVSQPIISLFSSLEPALRATPPNAILHFSSLYLQYAVSVQLAEFPNCYDFFSAENLSPVQFAIPYIGSDITIQSDEIDDEPGSCPVTTIHLSDVALEVISQMVSCLHPSSVSYLETKDDLLPTLLVADLHVLTESLLVQTSEVFKNNIVSRISLRVAILNKISRGPFPKLFNAVKRGFESQLSPRLAEVLTTYPGAQLTDYLLRELCCSGELVVPVLLQNDAICEKLTSGILSKEIGLSSATILMVTSMLQASPDETHRVLVRSGLPTNVQGFNKVDVHYIFHPLIMKTEGCGYNEAHRDATLTVSSSSVCKQSGREKVFSAEGTNGILTAISTKLVTVPSQPLPLNAAILTFLTQILSVGCCHTLHYFLWEDGPIVTAMTCIKDEIEQYAASHGDIKTRDMANAARRKLGIYEPLPDVSRKRGKDAEVSTSVISSFDAYVTLEEWRTELVTLFESIREVQLIQETELSTLELSPRESSSSSSSPRQPPSLLAAFSPITPSPRRGKRK
eukprot:TRINITY_DN9971_c6_g1_i1.p1 TRINITY_DN9971_c6_g1~~TRINITY_DN9971_c6_g1_i1.p1  ORF type:complete len:658 (+),score=69.49 TRINITY_DN9971_c6_g1_i1:23-1975(+)